MQQSLCSPLTITICVNPKVPVIHFTLYSIIYVFIYIVLGQYFNMCRFLWHIFPSATLKATCRNEFICQEFWILVKKTIGIYGNSRVHINVNVATQDSSQDSDTFSLRRCQPHANSGKRVWNCNRTKEIVRTRLTRPFDNVKTFANFQTRFLWEQYVQKAFARLHMSQIQ